jgi:hypothetical protein
MELDSSGRLVYGTLVGIAVLCWLGAAAFVGFRIYQMRTYDVVSALVLEAGPSGYMASMTTEDSDGFRSETYTTMYSAEALVEYDYKGKHYKALASHDVGVSSRWFQEQLTRNWKPGSRIRVRINPAKPDKPLAGIWLNLHTFTPAFGLIVFGLMTYGIALGVRRLLEFIASNKFFPFRPH